MKKVVILLVTLILIVTVGYGLKTLSNSVVTPSNPKQSVTYDGKDENKNKLTDNISVVESENDVKVYTPYFKWRIMYDETVEKEEKAIVNIYDLNGKRVIKDKVIKQASFSLEMESAGYSLIYDESSDTLLLGDKSLSVKKQKSILTEYPELKENFQADFYENGVMAAINSTDNSIVYYPSGKIAIEVLWQ